MKKKLIVSVITIVILAITIGFLFKHFTQTNGFSPDAVWVKTSKVKETTLPLEAHAIGTLTSRSVEITTELAGHVEKILFKDGSFVNQDDVLVQLDDAIYKAKYESAKAKLAYSENDYERKALLGKQGAIAKQAIDQALADLKENRAVTKESEVTMNKMKLIAPFSGMVGKSKVNLGDYVTVAQAVVTLTDIKHLRVEYNVPEKYLPFLKLGQEVKIKAAAYPDKIFMGKVAFISPTINTDNRSVSIYAEIDNENGKLAPGMFVDITQSLGKEEHAVMVPARSLVPILDGEQIYKVVDGKAQATTVLIGKRVGENVQITQGLSVGDEIITDGQLKLKNGIPIKIKS